MTILCRHCGKEIDESSAFCTFCGKKVEDTIKMSPKSPIDTESKTKEKRRCSKSVIVLLVLLGLILAISITSILYLYNKNKTLVAKNEELFQQLTDIRKEKADLEKEVKDAKSTIKKQKSEISKLEHDAEKVYKYLQMAGNSNGYISTNSKVYAVQKGSSITINVNWKKNGTQYVGSGENVSTSWTANDNVKVEGKNKGVTTVEFSSDSFGNKDAFDVVVICY